MKIFSSYFCSFCSRSETMKSVLGGKMEEHRRPESSGDVYRK